jgi:hypothetical protein
MPVMYTFYMFWPIRGLVLAVLLAWGLAPQLACLMPEQSATQSEMDCCKRMAADCSAANMSQTCCQTAVRTDIGIVAKTSRNMVPLCVASNAIVILPSLSASFDPPALKPSGHAPPPGGSSLILRI